MEESTRETVPITFTSLQSRIAALCGGSARLASMWMWRPNSTLGGVEPALLFLMGKADVLEKIITAIEEDHKKKNAAVPKSP